LYHNVTGNWALVSTNNVSGVFNETSFTLTLSDAYFGWNCKASGMFNNSGFAQENYTITVYTAAVAGGGGGGAPTPPTPPTPPPTTPPSLSPSPPPGPSPPPSAPAPSAAPPAGVAQTINTVSCEEKVSIVEEKISLEELLKLISVPEGYEVVAKPFKASCKGGETFSTSMMLPDNLENVTVLRCSGKACTSRLATYTTRICPGKEVEEFRKEDVSNATAAPVNLSLASASLTSGNRSLKSGNYSFDMGETVQATISASTEVQPLPANRNLRIVGTPIIIKFTESGSDVINVTIPYLLGQGDDESSVALYAKRREGNETRWLYVGGSVDTVKKVVFAGVNLSKYADGDEVTLAPMTSYCPECGETEFVSKFTPDPDSREAIILLHGLWGVGRVWDGLVNEFELTNQPYQIWTFSYLATKPLDESARDLANYLEANQYRFDKLYIVGYSLGGLVAQSALKYAYEERLKDPSKYSFLLKLNKVLLVGVPNDGTPVIEYLDTFISEYINSQTTDVMPMNSVVKDLLAKGISVEPVPNVSYYVIAGTQPYPFMQRLGLTRLLFGDKINDGLVSVESAQHVGTGYLDQDCVNFWARPAVHTMIIDDRIGQKILGQIIASDLFKELSSEDVQTNLFGYSNYFELEIDGCSPDDLYVVVGKEMLPSEVERAAYCACGNGICDGLEDLSTCPADCHVVEKPLLRRLIEYSLSMLALLIALLILAGLIFIFFERRRKKKPVPVRLEELSIGSLDMDLDVVEQIRSPLLSLKRELQAVKRRRRILGRRIFVAKESGNQESAALLEEQKRLESTITEFERELKSVKRKGK
jgi:pimeloyl-ACP methyl ester carboxylesterase